MRINTLMSLMLLLGLTACQNDVPEGGSDSAQAQVNQLLGRWELQQAVRSGKPTESLDGAYFEFFEEGKLVSNLGGSREELEYELNGETILQRGGRMQADYNIVELGDSVLVLQMTLNNIPFTLQLERGDDVAE